MSALEKMSGENFYITLPSNDGSKKYFPNNPNNSWKNKLAKRIDLEGEYRVGLSSTEFNEFFTEVEFRTKLRTKFIFGNFERVG